MSIVRVTKFTANTTDTDALLAKRAELIAAVRSAFDGPVATKLTRDDSATWTDTWTWSSAAHAEAAVNARLPLAAEAFALVTVTGVETAEVVDER
ncbi:hypothetical protein [Asanoa iriomotensis]|uniref:ABM domain-containing protein n=1 Tax=Asanoa iriomotensis TaxID=234613 RepID=A0ABQ4C737_9ACTN|nr:hypothetical protein [Asanoa iriomotensis]GIF58256.1 hypothetical protein Air01nite_43510 [Asanoa iriomotensis]